jgi:hypothetical protein
VAIGAASQAIMAFSSGFSDKIFSRYQAILERQKMGRETQAK